MAKASPIQTSFNAGEWAPELYGRVDLQKYSSACRRMRNAIPLRQGPATRRPGFRFLLDTDTSSPWLATFAPTAEATYLLAFRNSNLDIYSYQYNTGDQSVTFVQTIATPWTTSDLESQGLFRLSMVQSADVLYIASGTRTVRKLSRTGPTTFTLTEPSFKGGPWLPQNTNTAHTIHASAATGTVTLTASTGTFTANDVGRLVRLELADLTSVKPWEAGQKTPVLAVNDLRRSDGKTYRAATVAAGTAPSGATTLTYIRTGGNRPTHTFGKAWDGDQTTEITSGVNYISTGVEWEFQDPGYGVARITAFTNSTTVTAVVESRLPAGVVGAPNATWRWELGAWSAGTGYPERVCFFRERLCFARGFNVWMSVAGDFENFEDREFGEVLPDSAVTIEVLRDQANAIAWIKPLDDALIVGTRSGLFAIAEQNTSDPFGPANVRLKLQAGYGCEPIEPVQVGNSILFVQAGGRKLRELVFSGDSMNYIAADQSILAAHTIKNRIRQIAYAAEPNSTVWIRTGSTELVSMVWDKEQEIVAFASHPRPGVNAIATGPSTQRDALFITSQLSNGRRTVEMLAIETPEANPEVTLWADAGITTDTWVDLVGPEVRKAWITGLGHLRNLTVSVLVDGATYPPTPVVNHPTHGWSVELDMIPASWVSVGLPYQTIIEPMRIEAGASDGTAQGRVKKIARVMIRYINSLQFRVGRNDNDLSFIRLRDPGDPMDTGLSPKSGDWFGSVGGYSHEASVVIETSEPIPLTVSAIVYDLQTERA